MQTSSIILGPVETEKAVRMNASSQYALWVADAATKTGIRAIARTVLGVAPKHVTIITTKEKFRSNDRRKRSAQKKAILTFPAGTVVDLTKFAS